MSEMSEIFDPKPGELSYRQLDKLDKKEKFIIYRLVELGATVRNFVDKDDPTIVIEVPHNLAGPLNIEIGFLLNELAPGDFAQNLSGIFSCKEMSHNVREMIKRQDALGIRLVESYPTHLKYYVYRSPRRLSQIFGRLQGG